MSWRDRWSFAHRDRLIAAGQVPDVPPSDRSTLLWVSPQSWPQPPEGWSPDAGWKPDAQWPTAPEGWVFWQPIVTSPPSAPVTRSSAPGATPAVSGSAPTQVGDDEGRRALEKVLDRAIARVNRAQDPALRLRMVNEMDGCLESIPRWTAPEEDDPDYAATDLTRRDVMQRALQQAGVAFGNACVDLKARLLSDDTDFRTADFTLSCAMVEGSNELLLKAMNDRSAEQTDRFIANHRPQQGFQGPSDPAGDRSWVQAEQLAAAALRKFGFDDALPTGSGTDAGLDVAGRSIACQVKYTAKPVGRPVLQQLVGAAGGRVTAFFSRAGYTAQAVEYADQVGMALFGLTLPSTVSPQNSVAREMAG